LLVPAKRRSPTKAHPKPADALRIAAQVGRDGVAFFRRAKSLSADPRVKFIFGRAAEEFEKARDALEEVPGAKARGNAPAVFPFERFERMVCVVCGHEAKGKEPPKSCPACGAARYAFERDVKQDEAWNLVARSTKDALSFSRKFAQGAAKPAAKAAASRAIAIQKALQEEAKEERERVGAAP
jgi:hypothetical protein